MNKWVIESKDGEPVGVYAGETPVVSIPLEVAEIIDRVFLPLNPNKLRSRGSASPEVKAAAHAFRDAVHKTRLRHALRED
jgi:hypothetical protein